VRRLVDLLLLDCTGLFLLLLGFGHAEEVVEGESTDNVKDDVDPEDTVV
jgi:hypothetical protein